MKYYNVNTQEIVNFAHKEKKERYVNLPSGGVKHYASCTAEELASAGFKEFIEDVVPEDHAPGIPLDIEGATTFHRTYPDAVFDQDLADLVMLKAMQAIEVEYDAKLATVKDAIVVLLCADGGGMNQAINDRRADWQRILTQRDAAIDELLGV